MRQRRVDKDLSELSAEDIMNLLEKGRMPFRDHSSNEGRPVNKNGLPVWMYIENRSLYTKRCGGPPAYMGPASQAIFYKNVGMKMN